MKNDAHAQSATGRRRSTGGDRLGEKLTVNSGQATGNGERGWYGERDHSGATRACR